MKLSILPIVDRTVMARRKAQSDLALVETDKFVVMIDGHPQDDALKSAAKSAIVAELTGRIASLERDLDSYGVQVDR